MEQEFGYGPHLMLDLSECDATILDNLEACFTLLNTLPEIISMTKITQPYVFRYLDSITEDSGITGITIIAESHISIHTYPNKKFAFADVFSCKDFDIDKAKNYIVNFFRANKFSEYLELRGTNFPRAKERSNVKTS